VRHGIDLRYRRQQRLGVGHAHFLEQRRGRARSTTRPAYITATSSVRPATTPEVMGDQDHRHVPTPLSRASKSRFGLITHDLGVVAGRTDEVAVMYAGRVVERAPTFALFKKMRMPYTEALLAAIPKIDAVPHTPLPAISGRPPDPTRPIQGCSFSPRCRLCGRPMLSREALAGCRGIAGPPVCLLAPDWDHSRRRRMMQETQPSPSRDPSSRSNTLSLSMPSAARRHAVSDVSLQVARGETLGLVGESGCGKSTLGRAVLRLRRPVSGRVPVRRPDSRAMQGDPLRQMRRRVQLIFQDPIASLNRGGVSAISSRNRW